MHRGGHILLVGTLLTACTLGPSYERADTQTPPQFRQFNQAEQLASSESETRDAWWQQMGDETLDGLVQEALQNNQDLVRATAVVDEFAGSLKTTRSALFPQIGYSAGGERARLPPLPTTTTIDAGLTATWELDLFGQVRSATQAARAELLASEENRRAVILSLVTAVVAGYVDLRSLDKQLEIAEQTVEIRSQALALFDKRHKGGVISGVEYSQQESEYEAARAELPQVRHAVVTAENALAVLLGRSTAIIPRGKSIDALLLAPPPAGLPSDLLERRPDLRSAELQLIAANARIGIARAQYFPTISLTGFFGSRSDELDSLFEGPSRAWSYSGSVTGPIFRFGAVKGQVEVAEAQQRELLAIYQGAVQNAFADADRSLSQVESSQEILAAQTRQEDSLSRYARLARKRYEGGYTSYIDVLDAERSLFGVRLARAQSQADTVVATLNLYKALGGSWIDYAGLQQQTNNPDDASSPSQPPEID